MKAELEQQNSILRSLTELIKDPASIFKVDLSILKTDRVWILGAGKASVEMAKSLIKQTNIEVLDGLIISNTEHPDFSGIQIFKGSHPYPDESSVSASYELRELARNIQEGDTVVFCLSGGASSLLCIPVAGVEIEELALTYKLLLESGADIHEINIVRKHLCELKGGQLAQALHHTNLITLAISDVPGDHLESIGSAPTVCDPSTFKDAFQILKRFSLWNDVPHSVRIHIAKGMSGDIPDTPKPEINEHPNHTVQIISKASYLADGIANELQSKGFNTWINKDAYSGNVKMVSKEICSKAISVLSRNEPVKKPAALIYYGESTVDVNGDGLGGRNQELALASAISIEGQHSISMLSIGTDGVDGPTDSSGAIINSETTLKARKKKVEPEQYLQNNDSYHFHEEMETHIKLGPTGNNLMDLQVVIIE